MSVGTTQANATQSEVFGGTAYSAVATWYVGLFKASPGLTGSAADEVSGGSYNRVAVTNNVTNFPAAASGSQSNGTAITFPSPTADWATGGAPVTYVGICASGTPGTNDVRYYGQLTASQIILNGTTAPVFAAGALVITTT